MAGEKLSLRWDSHPSALVSALNKFLGNDSMCDLTLSAGSQSLKVHSLVVCACSSYFEVLFFLSFFAEYFQLELFLFSGDTKQGRKTSCGNCK